MADGADTALLAVDGLHVTFDRDDGPVEVVNGVTLRVDAGTITGLVGESGSGKSITSQAVLRLLPPRGHVTAGSADFAGIDLLRATERELRQLRGRRMSLVPQDPMTALNPGMRIGSQLALALRVHRRLRGAAARKAAVQLLDRVHVADPDEALHRFPHELSGGQRQRVVIALALAGGAELLIADEATTALDATTQLRILQLFEELRRDANLSILIITHDFTVIETACSAVYVMRAGRIVESGPTTELLERPRHAYTRELLSYRPDPAARGRPLGSLRDDEEDR